MNLHELVSKLIVDTKGSAVGSEVTLEELTAEMAGGQELEELSHELNR